MLKTILEPVKVVVNNRISKLALKKKLLKQSNYVGKAKEIWEMIDKDFGISNTIENVLKLKIDKFEQTLVKKFPELSSKDIEGLKAKIITESNLAQTIEASKVNVLKQLQDLSAKLKKENEKLKSELKKITSILPVKEEVKSNADSESIFEDIKLSTDNNSSDEK